MIVVEKTKDIGILKSLGASSRGIMSIFLGYGLSLGIVGSGVGMVLGLLFVCLHQRDRRRARQDHRARRCSIRRSITFHKIPTIVEPLTVAWIVLGAVVIAVMASVLPAHAGRSAASGGGAAL